VSIEIYHAVGVFYPTIARKAVGWRYGATVLRGWVGIDINGKIVANFKTKRQAEKWLRDYRKEAA
jgi:hypothetical protein